MSATGRSAAAKTGHVRAASDFYETPSGVVRAILPHLPALRPFDPCAGRGAILTASGMRGDGIELHEEHAEFARRAGHAVDTADALTTPWLTRHGRAPSLVIANPPFALAQEFVELALAAVDPVRGTVAMLLRLAFLESRKRAAFHQAAPADVFVLAERPSFTGNGKTDSAAVAWMVWGPGRGGRWSILAPEAA